MSARVFLKSAFFPFAIVATAVAFTLASAPARAQQPPAANAPDPATPKPATEPAPPKAPAPPAAAAEKPEAAKDAKAEPAAVELHGYVQPQFGVRNHPQALPRDRWEYGGLDSRAGFMISGTPVKGWSYMLHLSLDLRGLMTVTDVSLTDTNADGSFDTVSVAKRPFARTLFEEVSLSYQPIDELTIKAGSMRIPFTVALRTSNTALTFSNRPGPAEALQSGPDEGVLVQGHWLDERVQASLGAFTGSSLSLLPVQDATTRGLVYSLRVDASPLGTLSEGGTDFKHGPFRFGLGAGGLLRNGTLYDHAGYETTEVRELRASASLRASGLGFFFQAEGVRRLLSDSVTSRPNQASGAYAEASYFFPVTASVGLSPLARGGLVVVDELTLPRKTVYFDGGIALFPRADLPKPEIVRMLVQYQYGRQITDDDSSHALLVQGQLLF